jgi:RHS repeat-associated protein
MPKGATSLAETTWYSPFGESAQLSGSALAVGFQGDWTDSKTGEVDMGTRYYEPSLGRFSSRDVLFGEASDPMSLNQFVYAGGSPVTFGDSTGMSVKGCYICGDSDDDQNGDRNPKHGEPPTTSPPRTPPFGAGTDWAYQFETNYGWYKVQYFSRAWSTWEGPVSAYLGADGSLHLTFPDGSEIELDRFNSMALALGSTADERTPQAGGRIFIGERGWAGVGVAGSLTEYQGARLDVTNSVKFFEHAPVSWETKAEYSKSVSGLGVFGAGLKIVVSPTSRFVRDLVLAGSVAALARAYMARAAVAQVAGVPYWYRVGGYAQPEPVEARPFGAG